VADIGYGRIETRLEVGSFEEGLENSDSTGRISSKQVVPTLTNVEIMLPKVVEPKLRLRNFIPSQN
jgi:hypothetical protein